MLPDLFRHRAQPLGRQLCRGKATDLAGRERARGLMWGYLVHFLPGKDVL